MEIKGKYKNISVETYFIDETTREQLENLVNNDNHQEILKSARKIVVMPDTHAGKGGVIGLTMDLGNDIEKLNIAPDLIGPDIGCGVLFLSFETYTKIDLEKFHKAVVDTNENENIDIEMVRKFYSIGIPDKSLLKTFGTIGSGNHYVELYKFPNRFFSKKYRYAISIHTGSRTLGGKIFNFYNQKAKERELLENKNFETARKELIQKLKSEGKERDISHELAMFNKNYKEKLSTFVKDKNSLLYLNNEDSIKYLSDNLLLNNYAKHNRITIANSILTKVLKTNYCVMDIIDKPHNYVQYSKGVVYLRKGAQSAKFGEDVLIPLNMRDGIIVGKIDKETKHINFSFPHGAGRILSRTRAKQQIDLKKFKKEMKGIYSPTVGKDTLDEAPGAYKPKKQILKFAKKYLAKGYKVYKPIYNYKEIETRKEK